VHGTGGRISALIFMRYMGVLDGKKTYVTEIEWVGAKGTKEKLKTIEGTMTKYRTCSDVLYVTEAVDAYG
jgi:hypothetical protein